MQFVYMPTNVYWPGAEERRQISEKVFDLHHLPNIVGFIDGTQVRIIAPHEDEADYVNRKHYHSINVGLICDEQFRIQWNNASFPGSAHDSRVFWESRLYQFMRSGQKPEV
ncbi:unnamed protein product [Cylicostephanus goldi]|uniref:DDE Tnp4 domain-containing protein n=1 Tax=Cylicostephanus goldi TaxID=71465 RepID=A0A3P6TNT1_CYLGO|nr:unnamed protein product [Cylicostephanus goldi]